MPHSAPITKAISWCSKKPSLEDFTESIKDFSLLSSNDEDDEDEVANPASSKCEVLNNFRSNKGYAPWRSHDKALNLKHKVATEFGKLVPKSATKAAKSNVKPPAQETAPRPSSGGFLSCCG